MENQDQSHDNFFESDGPSNLPPSDQGPAIGDKLSKLPEKASDAFGTLGSFLSSLVGRFKARKIFIYVFLAVVVISIPFHYLLRALFESYFAGIYEQKIITANTEFKEGDIVIDGQPVVITRTDNSKVGVIHLRNKHKGLGADRIAYSWSIYSRDGSKLDSRTEYTYILPEQDKFIVVPLLAGAASLDASVEPSSVSAARPAFSREINLQAFNVSLGKFIESPGYGVTGQVRNPSLFEINKAEVVVLFRAPDNSLLAAASTEVGPLPPGEQSAFEVTWPGDIPANSIVDVRVYTNIYSPLNVNLPDKNISSPDIR